jgi:hypothetical protein
MPKKPPPIPERYQPVEGGLFPLIAGPLCGLTTNETPEKGEWVVPLVWIAPDRSSWLCDYAFDPVALRYLYADMRRVDFGVV